MDQHRNEMPNEAGDAFEKRLTRLPLRPVPEAWRTEILSAAHPRSSNPLTPSRETSGAWVERLLRRFPLSWAGLAAVWLFIFAANRTDRWLNGTVSYQAPQLSAEQWAALRAQRAELWVLAGLDRPSAGERDPADRPRDPALRPRSGLRRPSLPAFGVLNSGCGVLSV